jgi:hypothetical protein
LYLTFITTQTLSTTVGSTFGKTTVSCLVTSIDSTPLDVLIP